MAATATGVAYTRHPSLTIVALGESFGSPSAVTPPSRQLRIWRVEHIKVPKPLTQRVTLLLQQSPLAIDQRTEPEPRDCN